MLKEGSTGQTVKQLQVELNEHFDAKLKVDGVFGPKTEAAVDKAKIVLGFAGNGIVDEKTWKTILLLHVLKEDITPDPKPDTIGANALTFIEFYKANYSAVRAEVERWFAGVYSPNAVTNSCVAHVVSCLKLSGLSFPAFNTMAAINVDYFVEWALWNGWQKITDMAAIHPGDVCVSGPSQTDIDHVYSFVSYIDASNAKVLHNQKFGLAVRSLIGDGCGRWRFALRMK